MKASEFRKLKDFPGYIFVGYADVTNVKRKYKTFDKDEYHKRPQNTLENDDCDNNFNCSFFGGYDYDM